MNIKILPFFILLCTLLHPGFGQKRTVGAIAFYNVENLFDTEDDPDEEDEEYTPNGRNTWDHERYTSKLGNIAKVLSEMAYGADVIGLSEVENLFVLNELTEEPLLKKHGYAIVHKDSPSWRGIDCALLYKPDRFKLIDYRTIAFPDSTYQTRDILKVSGLYFGDTLHIYVNHWPSRHGGKSDKRMQVAEALRKDVDGLLAINPDSKIIVMGDLNDDPINKSVKKVLRAVAKSKGEGDLINVSTPTFKQGIGTLYYKGAWNLFDQIIVSEGLLNTEGVSYQPNSFSVFGPNWMRQKEGEYAGAPLRTFARGVYLNGYSDHFPSYILLEK